MTIKLLTKHNLEFLTLKGACTVTSESTLFKMPHCWESHVKAQNMKLVKFLQRLHILYISWACDCVSQQYRTLTGILSTNILSELLSVHS